MIIVYNEHSCIKEINRMVMFYGILIYNKIQQIFVRYPLGVWTVRVDRILVYHHAVISKLQSSIKTCSLI